MAQNGASSNNAGAAAQSATNKLTSPYIQKEESSPNVRCHEPRTERPKRLRSSAFFSLFDCIIQAEQCHIKNEPDDYVDNTAKHPSSGSENGDV